MTLLRTLALLPLAALRWWQRVRVRVALWISSSSSAQDHFHPEESHRTPM